MYSFFLCCLISLKMFRRLTIFPHELSMDAAMLVPRGSRNTKKFWAYLFGPLILIELTWYNLGRPTNKLLALAVPLELCLAIPHWQLNHVAVLSQELLILCWWGVLAAESIELRFCWLHMMTTTTTTMMIVDLYSALRRAPQLRYVSRCIVKRNVFSADRKDSMLSDGSRRWSGSRFQTIGPATENARRQNLLRRWQSVELTTETCCLFLRYL